MRCILYSFMIKNTSVYFEIARNPKMISTEGSVVIGKATTIIIQKLAKTQREW